MIKDVFLSSTFSDFQKERDLFRKRITTEISDRLSDSIINFVDLRWGIDTSNTNEAMEKVLRICSDVISQTKPMFILMLGDYYGSLPSEDDYKLIARMNNIDPYNIKSVTEFETIVSGIYDDKSNGFYLVLNRKIINKEDYPNSVFFEKSNKELLADFKNKVLNTNSIFIDYEAKLLNENEIEILNVDILVKEIVDNLYDYLIKDFSYNARNSSGLIYQIEHDFFVSLEEEKLSGFFGRKKEIEDICKLIDSKKIVYIDGKSGIGKTSLMVKLKDIYCSKGICVSYYCGDTFNKPSYSLILNYLSNFFQVNANDIYVLFKELPDENMHYIFIDAINESSDKIFENLNQNLILDNVKIIISGVDLNKADYVINELDVNDVLSIINVKCNQRYKEVPNQFFNFLENNNKLLKLLCYPIQLNFFINSIMNLNEKDFYYIKNAVTADNKSFIEVLSSVFINKLEKQNDDFYMNIDSVLNDNNDFKIILLITKLCLRGVSLEQLSKYYNIINSKEFSTYDFYNMRYSLGDLYQKDFAGNYHITHSLLKNYIDNCFSYDQTKKISEVLVDFILSKKNISFNEYAEVLYQLYHFNNIEKLSIVLENLFLNKEMSNDNLKNIYELSLSNEKYSAFKSIVDFANPYAISFFLKNMGYIDFSSKIINLKTFEDAYEVLVKYKNDNILNEWYQDVTLFLYDIYTDMTNQKRMAELFINDQSLLEYLPFNNFIMIINNKHIRIDSENQNNLFIHMIDSLKNNVDKNTYDEKKLKDFIGETILALKALNNHPMEMVNIFNSEIVRLIVNASIKLLNNNQVFINNKIYIATQYCYFSLIYDEFKNDINCSSLSSLIDKYNDHIYSFLANYIDKYESSSLKDIDVYKNLMLAYYALAVHYKNDICLNNFLHFLILYSEINDDITSILDLNQIIQIIPNVLKIFNNCNGDYNILKNVFKNLIHKYDYIGDFSIAVDSLELFLQCLYLAMASTDDIDEYLYMIDKINNNVFTFKVNEYFFSLKWIMDALINFHFIDELKAIKVYDILIGKLNKVFEKND